MKYGRGGCPEGIYLCKKCGKEHFSPELAEKVRQEIYDEIMEDEGLTKEEKGKMLIL
jgi:hypothetical protein